MLNTLKDYTWWLFRMVFIAVLFIGLLDKTPLGRDDTDPGEWGARSGFKPYTDALTGCQYLGTPSGGLIPRVNREGHHLGCK